MAGGDGRDLFAVVDHERHRVRQLAQRGEHLVRPRDVEHAGLVGEGQRQQQTGRDLRVERFGRRDAHLHVAPVRREQHAVGFVDEVTVAAVDDADNRRAARPRQVDRAVGIGGGATLADGNDERVGHVVAEPEARELRRGQRFDREPAAGRRGERAARLWPATAAVP